MDDILNLPSETKSTDIPLVLITAHNRNPPVQETIRKFWSLQGRSSAMRYLSHRNVIGAIRRPPNTRDKLVKAKIATPKNKIPDQCKGPQTCKYYTRISQSWTILNLNNERKDNTIRLANCKSSQLISWLEAIIWNRIIDRFQAHLFDIKHNTFTIVAWHVLTTIWHLPRIHYTCTGIH